jgi:hypothetical protein
MGTPVSSTTKTEHHDINEILLKVVLKTRREEGIDMPNVSDSHQ